MKVSIVVPVLNPGSSWQDWLKSIDKQSVVICEKVIIDSSSTDGYVEQSLEYGYKIISIHQNEFDHGATRQLALSHIGNSDIVVYLTQDAILENSHSIKNLIDVFEDDAIAIAYG